MLRENRKSEIDMTSQPRLQIKRNFGKRSPYDIADMQRLARAVKPMSERFSVIFKDATKVSRRTEFPSAAGELPSLRMTLSIAEETVIRVCVAEDGKLNHDFRQELCCFILEPDMKQTSVGGGELNEVLHQNAVYDPQKNFSENQKLESRAKEKGSNSFAKTLCNVEPMEDSRTSCDRVNSSNILHLERVDVSIDEFSLCSPADDEAASCSNTGSIAELESSQNSRNSKRNDTASVPVFQKFQLSRGRKLVDRQNCNKRRQLADDDILDEGQAELEKAFSRMVQGSRVKKPPEPPKVLTFHGKTLLNDKHLRPQQIPLEPSKNEQLLKWEGCQLVACIRDPRLRKDVKYPKLSGSVILKKVLFDCSHARKSNEEKLLLSQGKLALNSASDRVDLQIKAEVISDHEELPAVATTRPACNVGGVTRIAENSKTDCSSYFKVNPGTSFKGTSKASLLQAVDNLNLRRRSQSQEPCSVKDFTQRSLSSGFASIPFPGMSRFTGATGTFRNSQCLGLSAASSNTLAIFADKTETVGQKPSCQFDLQMLPQPMKELANLMPSPLPYAANRRLENPESPSQNDGEQHSIPVIVNSFGSDATLTGQMPATDHHASEFERRFYLERKGEVPTAVFCCQSNELLKSIFLLIMEARQLKGCSKQDEKLAEALNLVSCAIQSHLCNFA